MKVKNLALIAGVAATLTGCASTNGFFGYDPYRHALDLPPNRDALKQDYITPQAALDRSQQAPTYAPRIK